MAAVKKDCQNDGLNRRITDRDTGIGPDGAEFIGEPSGAGSSSSIEKSSALSVSAKIWESAHIHGE
ncbi:MAG: hypothetical protein HC888_03175 [Candidatus Competibacteraceae bacterium]|nr:hypothetical protein [Candidatus Competibacteraceae bacterium]